MAKIAEQYIVVKMSRLVKDSSGTDSVVGDDVVAAINKIVEDTMEELDPTVIVEIENSGN